MIELPAGVTAVAEPLPHLLISTAACTGCVYLQGAHLTAWTPAGADPVLWMSSRSAFAPGKAIRGGVPVCFPWFGGGRSGDLSPAHGFARIVPWTLAAVEVDADGRARLTLVLDAAVATGGPGADLLPAGSRATYTVSMGATLELALRVDAGPAGLDVEEALHTYLSVGDIHRVQVRGLDGASYFDKVAGTPEQQAGDVVFTGETDRVYASTATTQVVDPALGRVIEVAKSDSANTVVWNPWIAKSAAMADFGDDEWPGMVCVETANVGTDAVTLGAGESRTMTARIGVHTVTR